MGVKNVYIIGENQLTASSALGIEHLEHKREAVNVKIPWTPEYALHAVIFHCLYELFDM